ncbi:MAG: cell division protein ZapA, partial [Bacteroidia bacterium]|nr:cell division protein ZapA [Bacteroidia bacterium]
FYIENFSVQDKQDALSMVALEFASNPNDDSLSEVNYDNINSKLMQIERMLDL